MENKIENWQEILQDDFASIHNLLYAMEEIFQKENKYGEITKRLKSIVYNEFLSLCKKSEIVHENNGGC